MCDNLFNPQDFVEEGIDSIVLNTDASDCYEEPAEWSIITALERILNLTDGCRLSDAFWEACKSPLAFLTKALDLNKVQVVFVAIMVETGEPMSWRKFARFLSCTRLSVMVYSADIEDLLAKRWVVRRGSHERGETFEGYALAHGVVTALRHNKRFEPEKIEGLTIQTLIDRMESYVEKNVHRPDSRLSDIEEWMLQLCKANTQLPLCRKVLRYEKDIHVQSLLLFIVVDYAQWEGSDDEGLTISSIDYIYPDEFEVNDMRKHLKDGSHALIRAGLIEHKCVDGVADPNRYTLTSKCKEELLIGYLPSRSKCSQNTLSNRNIKSCSLIKEKQMFYNASEQEQISQLTSLLQQEKFIDVQTRLEQEGMRKGFACLFYGSPGTGKTETVLQIAKQTGRDIMQVDIAGMRNKYVGESEKNIKNVFRYYRELCKQREVIPILLFNEADALINKRTEKIEHSVDKMDNAMQNIILQELEDLEGILIATTNLSTNLDDAFERRFLFKVEFHKPQTDVKAKLWKSMLGDNLSAEEASYLAQRYDFSGGQIENIARKQTIHYIINGKQAMMTDIETFCQTELLNKSNMHRNTIGFNR